MRARLEVDLAHPEGSDRQSTESDVLEETIRLQGLVDDLLALASLDAATAPERNAVDLDEIVLSEARRTRAHTTHRIDTSGVSGAQLNGDVAALTRAVRNLLDNATRHAHSLVTMTLTESDDAATLIVTDDGDGIPADQQRRIFDRFTRLDAGRARDAGGTGLGLAITHDVVVAHGGTITVTGSPGARFTISLPRSSPAQRPRV
jgi:signal transduction histidine kinase